MIYRSIIIKAESLSYQEELRSMGLIKLRTLIEKGKYNQAHDEIAILPQDDKIEGQILKSRIHEQKGQLDEAKRVVKHSMEEIQEKGINNQKLKTVITPGYISQKKRAR